MSIVKGYLDNHVKAYLEYVNILNKNSKKVNSLSAIVDLLYKNPDHIEDYVVEYINELDVLTEKEKNNINHSIVGLIYWRCYDMDKKLLSSRKEMVERYKNKVKEKK
jgi:hypothetical protein